MYEYVSACHCYTAGGGVFHIPDNVSWYECTLQSLEIDKPDLFIVLLSFILRKPSPLENQLSYLFELFRLTTAFSTSLS